MKTAGYSGTPLEKKLGIKDGFKVRIVNQPDHYFDLFEYWPKNIEFKNEKKSKKDFVHYFTRQVKELERDIIPLKNEIVSNGIIWISWPKKSSNCNRHYGRHHSKPGAGKWISGCESLCGRCCLVRVKAGHSCKRPKDLKILLTNYLCSKNSLFFQPVFYSSAMQIHCMLSFA